MKLQAYIAVGWVPRAAPFTDFCARGSLSRGGEGGLAGLHLRCARPSPRVLKRPRQGGWVSSLSAQRPGLRPNFDAVWPPFGITMVTERYLLALPPRVASVGVRDASTSLDCCSHPPVNLWALCLNGKTSADRHGARSNWPWAMLRVHGRQGSGNQLKVIARSVGARKLLSPEKKEQAGISGLVTQRPGHSGTQNGRADLPRSMLRHHAMDWA